MILYLRILGSTLLAVLLGGCTEEKSYKYEDRSIEESALYFVLDKISIEPNEYIDKNTAFYNEIIKTLNHNRAKLFVKKSISSYSLGEPLCSLEEILYRKDFESYDFLSYKSDGLKRATFVEFARMSDEAILIEVNKPTFCRAKLFISVDFYTRNSDLESLRLVFESENQVLKLVRILLISDANKFTK